MDFFIYLIISLLISYGMAILLVEKGNKYPIRRYKLLLKLWLHDNIHWKFCQFLECTTCCSFWATLFSDIIICILACSYGQFYFFWPFSGIICAGITWTIIEWLNKDTTIMNVINGEKKDEN